MIRTPTNGIYEKPKDLATEKRIASMFAIDLNCKAIKIDWMGQFHPIDYEIRNKDNKLICLLEVRGRDYLALKSNTFYIHFENSNKKFKILDVGIRKWYDMLKEKSKHNVPVYFVYALEDSDYALVVNNSYNFQTGLAPGRPNCTVARITDKEKVYKVPRNLLTRIN